MKHLKETFSLNCAVAAAGSFLAGGLIPLSMYIGNFREFSAILPGSMLLYALLGVSVCFVSIFFLLSVVALAGKRIYGYFIALFSALVIAVYAQGNVIGAKYPLLDGKSIPWDKMIGIGVVNTIIWIVIIGLGGAVYWKWKERSFPVLRTVMFSFFFFMVLTVGLRFATLKTSAAAPAFFSGKDFYKVSSKRNIFVFVLDSFERDLLEQLLKEDPSVAETLSDFTFYKNSIGKFPGTTGALPHILTGTPVNVKLPYNMYIDTAMQSSPLIKAAQQLDYDLYFYVASVFAPTAATGEKTACLANVKGVQKFSSTGAGDYFTIYQNSLFSYVPHFMKKSFLVDQFTVKSAVISGDMENMLLHPEKVSALIDNIPERKKLTIGTGRKVFKLFHLVGVHAPNFNLQTARHNIDYLKRFFAELKRLGIYDSSSIVIVGDHGLAQPQYPIFLYKNTKNGMKFSNEPFSFDNLNSLLAELLKRPDAKPVFSKGMREFWVWNINDRNTVKKTNFALDGRPVRSDETEKETYSKGELNELWAENMSMDTGGRWTYADAKISIPVPAKFRNRAICLKLKTSVLAGPQYFVQKIDFLLGNLKLKSAVYHYPHDIQKEVKLFIPQQYNTAEQITIGFSALHYASPKLIGLSQDLRNLGVLISGCTISPYENIYFPDDLKKLPFKNMVAGHSGLWAGEGVTSIELPVSKEHQNKDIILTAAVTLPMGPENPSQELAVSVNNKPLGIYYYDDRAAWASRVLIIRVAKELNTTDHLRLTIEGKYAVRMKDVLPTTEERPLSFLLRQCEMRPLEEFSQTSSRSLAGKRRARSVFEGENLVALLSEGLSDEKTGRWTYSRKSSLTVPLKRKYVQRDLIVTFDTQTLLSKKFPTQSLTCYLGKEKLAAIKYQYPRTRKRLRLYIPQKLHGGKDLKFVFETEYLRSPAQMFDGNPDKRMLGVNLCSCRISTPLLPKWLRKLWSNK